MKLLQPLFKVLLILFLNFSKINLLQFYNALFVCYCLHSMQLCVVQEIFNCQVYSLKGKSLEHILTKL